MAQQINTPRDTYKLTQFHWRGFKQTESLHVILLLIILGSGWSVCRRHLPTRKKQIFGYLTKNETSSAVQSVACAMPSVNRIATVVVVIMASLGPL
jgi:hypothetical protein